MEKESRLEYIEISKISPCPYQCRISYDMESMQVLVNSIKENGILQPLTATKTNDGYQLISGHRRLFAARVLNMEKVPVIVMEKSTEEIAFLCAVENMHREDLNFFEQAQTIKMLIDTLGITQQQAGEKLCLTQSAIANKLRVLSLDKNLQSIMVKNNLTERHARSLTRLPAEKREKALNHIVKNQLNVQNTEKYIETLITPKPKKRKLSIHIKDIKLFTNSITKALGIMKNAGFAPQFDQEIKEDSVEYKIVIPLKK